MPIGGYYYYGTEARQIRKVTIAAVKAVTTTALTDAGETVGENGLVLVRSASSAHKRFTDRKPFLYLALRPTKETRCILHGHDDNLSHSGRRYDWQFLIQVSRGATGGLTTGDQTTAADDDLMDVVRDALVSQYVYFRETLKFFDFRVTYADEAKESGSILNPLRVSFYNKIRMASDEFITVPI